MTLLRRAWAASTAGLLAAVALAGQAWPDSYLPWMPLNAPQEGLLPDGQEAALLQLADAALAAHAAAQDAPSRGWIGPAMERLSDVLDEGEARIAADYGPAGRALARFLGDTLWLREEAEGWDAMASAAERAVAMERQLSANAAFFDDYFQGSFLAAATGNQTEVLEAALLHLSLAALNERERGDPSPTRSEELAFRLAQAGFTGDTAMAALRPIRRDPIVFGDAERHAQVQDLQVLLEQLTTYQKLVDDGALFLDADAVEASADDAMNRVTGELDALLSAQVDVADVLFPWIYGVSDIQRSLKPDEAVAMIVPSGPIVLVFALTQNQFLMREAKADINALRDSITRLTEAVGRPLGRGAVAIEDEQAKPSNPDVLRTEAAAVYDGLLGPVESILRDKQRLYVVATARLGLGFPFEMLLTEPARPGQSDSDLPWLVRRHAVLVVPTVELLWMREFWWAAPPQQTYYLGLGAPDYVFPSALGRTSRATRILSDLVPLADSAEEVQAVAAAFGKQNGIAMTGADANEYNLIKTSRSGLLKQFTVLHFATHGLVFEDHPDVADPLLALTPMLDLIEVEPMLVGSIDAPSPDGILEAHEVRQLDLAARLVILSACSSGRADMDEDGLTSLGAAFMAAGAQKVLGTHRPVYSDAAVEIVTGMAARDPKMADPALALRQTLLALIDSGGRKADPSWWGAFSLVGRP
jgi:CHAT domain-containing protein